MRIGNPRQDRGLGNTAVLSAVEALFRPLARVLVEHGISSPEAESLLRAVWVHQLASEDAARRRRPNVSWIALVAGLDRKAVSLILKSPPRMGSASETHSQWANRVLDGWHSDPAFTKDDTPRVLPVKSVGSKRPSFWTLARRYSPGVYPGLILRELCRVGAVEKLQGGMVRARRRRYRARELSDEHASEMDPRVRKLLQSIGVLPNKKARQTKPSQGR